MDNFVESITHKFTSTDMIRANQQADAAMIDNQKEQIARFEVQLEKVDASLKQMHEVSDMSIDGINKTSEASIAGINRTSEASIAEINKASGASIDGINKTSEASIAGINKTVDESLAKIAKISDDNSTVAELAEKLEKMQKEMEEYLHSDHVKIYRNMQTSIAEEIVKQSDDIKKDCRRNKALLPIAIITMLGVLAHLAFDILKIYGII